MQPTPMFLRSEIATSIAVSFSEIWGNTANVKNSGNNQKLQPNMIMSVPLKANRVLELCIMIIKFCNILTSHFRIKPICMIEFHTTFQVEASTNRHFKDSVTKQA